MLVVDLKVVVDPIRARFRPIGDEVLRLQAVLPFLVTTSVMYLHFWDDFDNRNTYSGLAKKRDDEVDRLWLHMERPLGAFAPDGMRIFGDYRFRSRESDVGFFDYHQHIFGMGLAWDF